MKKVCVFCLLFLFSESPLAKFHLEPYIGYGATFTGKPLNVSEDSISTSARNIQEGGLYYGVSGGARVGYSRLGLAFGLDLTFSQMTSSSHTLTPLLYGVFASYKLPLFFRIYGALIPGRLWQWPLSRIYTAPRQQNADTTTCEAWGGKVGISYLSLPFLSINFEYQPVYMSGPKNCQGILSHSAIAYLNFTL